MSKEKLTPYHFIKLKREGRKIVMVTAYEYVHAKLADEVGIDGVLVGDSLGMVIMGYRSTLPVSFREVAHHLKAVLSASPRALVVADMPFLTYEVSREEAVRNAGRYIKMGADAVKIEGGVEVVDKVEAMVKAGIPVMGHVGLNPQRYLVLGMRVRGKTAEDGVKLYEDSKALEEAGVFSIVIEFTTAEVAAEVTKLLRVPTICIGAGPYCDGQILVFHDLVGLNIAPPPFVKKYTDGYEVFRSALRSYTEEVRSGVFPDEKHFFKMVPEELKRFVEQVSKRRAATSERTP
ncbi:MAG: 3-methyl-2-oxobutanoate hydroxymethyltransferase [Sulfolobales archaeon]|nr:3-methyl-2-oxobutanoate hydroxymethyltransferase [Sulfolobales archaeon]MDW8082935.1 3-methyl-2-oxobutanoate hydroxymethyltransferase [Sulfolobales archaeon]